LSQARVGCCTPPHHPLAFCGESQWKVHNQRYSGDMEGSKREMCEWSFSGWVLGKMRMDSPPQVRGSECREKMRQSCGLSGIPLVPSWGQSESSCAHVACLTKGRRGS
jgi:hypothetical protein